MGSTAQSQPLEPGPAPEPVIRTATPPPMSAFPPRILIIGAGSRGQAYAQAIKNSTNGIVVAIAEPIEYKRISFGRTYIWGQTPDPPEGTCFPHWGDFHNWEVNRRELAATGKSTPAGIDAAFVCVQDEAHRAVVEMLCRLGGIHIMCEKPLATTLPDVLAIDRALRLSSPVVFSIGHVLRYSPHNDMLRQLLVHDRIIGDILSVNHTEPVGWWHFAHSYVRGNWRRADTSAPSLLTKCCHDIDVLLWLLCSPARCADGGTPHLPKKVSSTGALQLFRRGRKPVGAGAATNCLSCPVESDCKFSAKKVYVGDELKGLGSGNTKWPVSIVLPEIEDIMSPKGGKEYGARLAKGEEALLEKLAEDYDENTPGAEIAGRNWFGRCVFESDNDVCDEQVVTITWDDDPLTTNGANTTSHDMQDNLHHRGAKTATFHMVASTAKICERFTNIYGTDGEVYADGTTITVTNFTTGETKTYNPRLDSLSGHGGGDSGLARQFVLAVDKVKNHGWAVERAQNEIVECTLDEVTRSHAMVFCAEAARKEGRTLNWKEWWNNEVDVVSFQGGEV